jgi:hypothetical protein
MQQQAIETLQARIAELHGDLASKNADVKTLMGSRDYYWKASQEYKEQLKKEREAHQQTKLQLQRETAERIRLTQSLQKLNASRRHIYKDFY